MSVLYELLKKIAGIAFNILNTLIGGNLPPFSCVSVIVEDQNRYLVIESPQGKVAFPGGFMRWREHPALTARREGKEETGLELRIGDLIGCYSQVSTNISRMSTTMLVYYAEIVGGELRSSIEGKAYWIDEDELRQKMAWFHQGVLDDYLHFRQQGKKSSTPTRIISQERNT